MRPTLPQAWALRFAAERFCASCVLIPTLKSVRVCGRVGPPSKVSMYERDTVTPLILTYGVDIASAFLILAAGWMFAAWVRRFVRRTLDRTHHIDPTLKPMIANIIRYLILAFVLIAVLAKFGIQTTSILALVGAAGLAIGLALQGTLSNVASGVMLLLLRPFGVGDAIDAEGVAGTVLEIGLFSTDLETADGVYMMVPNSHLFGRAVKNFSRLPCRKIDVTVAISHKDDVDAAINIAFSVLKADERLVTDKPSEVVVSRLRETAVELSIRGWTHREDLGDFTSDLQRAVKQQFEAEGILFPQREFRMIRDEKNAAENLSPLQ